MQHVEFRGVSFSYDAMASPLIEDLSLTLAPGWTGVVGPNGVGKTTILRLATGGLQPDGGHVAHPDHTLYCAQRTDDPPGRLADLLDSEESEAYRVRGRLGVQGDWLERWGTLSHGERKRAQIAVALWQEPLVLAVDEPTNHLDAAARTMLSDALVAFGGIGILVSHDRELLDTLCSQCLFVDPPETVLRTGGYTGGVKQLEMAEDHRRTEYERGRKELKKLEREATKRREQASRSHRLRSKRGIPIADHDARFRKNLARVTGKDGQAGRLLNQMDGRIKQVRERTEGIKVRPNYDLGIWVTGEVSKRNLLFGLGEGRMPLGEDRWLEIPALAMQPTDRIALTGENGSGKSTLVVRIVAGLDLGPDRLTYIPQEIGRDASLRIMTEARQLPRNRLGRMMAIVRHLGSAPARLLESEEPSPGEIRKLLLATGIAKDPHLIIMDEPTNHLDLPSIECLEQALSDCPCGLLLVSHDQRFLDRLTDISWHIEEKAGGSMLDIELKPGRGL